MHVNLITEREEMLLKEIEELKKKLECHQISINYLQEELIKFRGYE